MKRLICLLLLIATALGMTANAADDTTNIRIEEAEISLDVPNDCYVLTQNIENGHPYIEKTGANRKKIEEYYKESGIVLDAIAKDDSYEIVVTLNKSNKIDYIYNMHSISDEQMKEFARTIEDTYKNYGYDIDGHETYTVNDSDATYICFSFSQNYDNKSVKCRQYYTIRDNNIYSYTLRVYNSTLYDMLSQKMDTIIDSVQYMNLGSAIEYSYSDVGVSYSLSVGWNSADNKVEDKKVSGNQYYHSNNLGETIQLSYVDLWAELSPFHRFFTTRKEMELEKTENLRNNNVYIKSFFPESTTDTVHVENYAGVDYWVCDVPVKIESDKLNGEYFQRSVVTLRNGILYAFQYGYYQNAGIHEKDFENMLESVQYDDMVVIPADEKLYREMTSMLYLILDICVVVVIVMILIIILYIKSRMNSETVQENA